MGLQGMGHDGIARSRQTPGDFRWSSGGRVGDVWAFPPVQYSGELQGWSRDKGGAVMWGIAVEGGLQGTNHMGESGGDTGGMQVEYVLVKTINFYMFWCQYDTCIKHVSKS